MKFNFRNEKKRRIRTFDDVLRDLPVDKKQQIEKILEAETPKEYSPSAKEIVNEVHKDVKDYLSKKPYVPYLNFLSSAIKSFIFINIMPYALPSTINYLKKSDFLLMYDNPKEWGCYIGVVLGASLAIITYAEYIPKKLSLEYLLIPVATNLGSGIYETVKSARNRLIEKNIQTKIEDHYK